jgi:hypothetical protein
MVVRGRDGCGSVSIRHSEVDTSIIVNANRRVTGAGRGISRRVLNMTNVPGYSVVL